MVFNGRAREVSWFDGGFSDGLADESDILLSLIVWHPGSNQEDFAMPKRRRRTDNGLQWQSGQAAQVVFVPQPTWVTQKPSRRPRLGKVS